MASLPTRMRGKGAVAGGGGMGFSDVSGGGGTGQQPGDAPFSPDETRFENPYFSANSPFDPALVLPKGIAKWEQVLSGWITYVRRSQQALAFVVAAFLHLTLSVVLQAESAAVRGGGAGLLLFALRLPLGFLVSGTLLGALLVGAPALLTLSPQVIPWLHVALAFLANEWVALDHTISDSPGGHIHLSSQENCSWPCFRGLKSAFWNGHLGLLNLLLVLAVTGLHSVFTAQQEQKRGRRPSAGSLGGKQRAFRSSGSFKLSPKGLKLRTSKSPGSPLGGNDSDKDQPGSFRLGGENDEMSPITYNARMEKMMAQKAGGGKASTQFQIAVGAGLAWLCISVLSTGVAMVQTSAVSGWVGHPTGAPLDFIIGVRNMRAALGIDAPRHTVPSNAGMHSQQSHQPPPHHEVEHGFIHEDEPEDGHITVDHYESGGSWRERELSAMPPPHHQPDRHHRWGDTAERRHDPTDHFESGGSWREREQHPPPPPHPYHEEVVNQHHEDVHSGGSGNAHAPEAGRGEDSHVGHDESPEDWEPPNIEHHAHHDPATQPAGEGGFLEMADEWAPYAGAVDGVPQVPHTESHQEPPRFDEHSWETHDGPQMYVHPEAGHPGHPDEAIHHGDHFDYEEGDAWKDFHMEDDEGEDWDDVDWELEHTRDAEGAAVHDPAMEESHGEGGHDPDFDAEAVRKEEEEEERAHERAEHEGDEGDGKDMLHVDAELVKKVYWPMYADMDMERETDEEQAILAKAVSQLREHCKKHRPNIVLLSIDSLTSHRAHGGNPVPVFDPVVAPNLHKLEAEHAIRFPEVYVPTPSSLATMVFLATGGVGPLTEASENEWVQYRGTTMPRVLNRLGWRTAYVSAEDTRPSQLDRWLWQQDYDWVATRDMRPELFEVDMSQWGGTDDAAVDAALKFANDTAIGEPEFFIQLHLHATHHPYSVPSNWTSSLNETMEDQLYSHVPSMVRFRRALHYTDEAVGRLVAGLEHLGLWNNTLFLVTSNHGEAFGDPHEGNFLHANFLFEENVRSFLVIGHSDPAAIPHSLEVRIRPGSVGDIFPTLMDIIGGPKDGRIVKDKKKLHEGRHHAKFHEEGEESDMWADFAKETMAHDVMGRMVLREEGHAGRDEDDEDDRFEDLFEAAPVRGVSLVGEKHEWRTIFFYRPGHAPMWGLRDGRWKFIGHRHHHQDELYDIIADSWERLNLARHYINQTHQQVEIFHSRCDRWFDYIECAWMGHGACFRSYDESDGEMRVAKRKEHHHLLFPVDMHLGTGHGHDSFVPFPNRNAVPSGLPSITLAVHWNPLPHARVLYFDLAPASILSPTAMMHVLEGHDQPCWDQASAFPGPCTSIHGGNARWQIAFRLQENWDASWFEFMVGGEVTSGDWAVSIWAEDGITRLGSLPFTINPHTQDDEAHSDHATPESHEAGKKVPEAPPAVEHPVEERKKDFAKEDSTKEDSTKEDSTKEDSSKEDSTKEGGQEGKGEQDRRKDGHVDQSHEHEKRKGSPMVGTGRKGLIACGPPYEVHMGMIKNAGNPEDQEFVNVDRWHPMQDVVTVKVSWPPCAVSRHINYFFTSRHFPIPAWEKGTALNHTVDSKWRTSWFWWKPDRPIAVDQWQLLVMEGNRVLARKPFYVDPAAALLI